MIKPKKSLGQNFLIDNNILNKIIKLAEINNENIIEIGPGTGNLTKKIIEQKPKSLILIEKDQILSNNLKKELKEYDKLKFFNEDVLKLNLRNGCLNIKN
jgi:16S rRNA (adenine1518-N6/adenine1519-N6)-dimethyltransferase